MSEDQGYHFGIDLTKPNDGPIYSARESKGHILDEDGNCSCGGRPERVTSPNGTSGILLRHQPIDSEEA